MNKHNSDRYEYECFRFKMKISYIVLSVQKLIRFYPNIQHRSIYPDFHLFSSELYLKLNLVVDVKMTVVCL